MKLTFKAYPENGYAWLSCDDETQAALLRLRDEESDEWGTCQMEGDILESLLCNSEWEWIDPSETGDLTDAPMIGIKREDGWVLERYAFMPYALRSFLDDLTDKGESRWEGGK